VTKAELKFRWERRWLAAVMFRRAMLLALAVLTVCGVVCAQRQAQPDKRDLAGPSDLAVENLSHVSASAAEIQAVLQAQPGLLVELKRWAAKDAADHGQVVADADLADQAIFNRLNNDNEFRAVATRLLQRYGYLLPKINPDSDTAKENELVLKERAIRLARMEEEERTTKTGEEKISRPSACDPARDRNCEENEIPPPTQQRPRVTRTEALPDADLPEFNPGTPVPVFPEGSVQGAGSRTIQLRETNLGQASLASGTQPRANDLSSGLSEESAEAAAETLNRGMRSEASMPPPVGESKAEASPRARMNLQRGERPAEQSLASAGMLRRPNPYADIPSLYDMYLQASPRPPRLERFGADVFSDDRHRSELLPMDLPVGADYVVGPGDGLTIDLWGGISERLFRTVDREGRVALPEAGPVLASGRTLGELQQAVQQILRTQYRDVFADVSLARLRTVRVYVVGDVEHPGAYDISSLSTPLNALFEAGGPTAGGSLRMLRHYRGKQLVEDVDVYDLLLHGVRSGMQRLENGDTVQVPPIGPQIAVEGMVRRPAAYELRGEKNLAEALELAGGILPAAALRHIEVQRLVAHEKRTMLSLDVPETQDAEAVRHQLESFAIQDGDDVRIFPIAPFNQDAVYLEGHVLRPGRYSYHQGMKLTEVISSYSDLLPEPAAQYAEIIRLKPPDYRPSVESFDLAAVLASPTAAPSLEPLDTIRIYGRYDFQNPPIVSVLGEVRAPGTYRTAGQIHLRDAIQMAGGVTPDAQTDTAQVFEYLPDSKLRILSVNLSEALADNPLDNILLKPRDRVVVHRNPAKVDPAVVTIQGEVGRAGRYPLTTNLRVDDLIRLAGGVKRSADTENADLTHYPPPGSPSKIPAHQKIRLADAMADDPQQNLLLHDGDVLTIPQVPGWSDIGATVTVGGEVVHPGTYGIQPGERLSSVLRRAGGFLPTADPRAAVLERSEVRQLQERSKQELIQRIEQEAASFKTSITGTAQEQSELQQAALRQRQQTVQALRNAPTTGRLVIHLRWNLTEFEHSPDNIAMRAGDSLYIPKVPNFVLVVGQVYNSNAITYIPRRDAGWYLAQAGGPTGLAEKKAIFIVRANGGVVTGRENRWWSGNVLSTQVEPGDTIIVPEKAVGGSAAWKNLLGLAQIAETASVTALVVTR
jgi:protein involved in polysaccharide export with SLBB domain